MPQRTLLSWQEVDRALAETVRSLENWRNEPWAREALDELAQTMSGVPTEEEALEMALRRHNEERLAELEVGTQERQARMARVLRRGVAE